MLPRDCLQENFCKENGGIIFAKGEIFPFPALSNYDLGCHAASSYAWSINRTAFAQSCTLIGGGKPRCPGRCSHTTGLRIRLIWMTRLTGPRSIAQAISARTTAVMSACV